MISGHRTLNCGAVEFARKRISKLTDGTDPALAVLEKALADGRLSARVFAQRLAGEDPRRLNELEDHGG